MILVGSQTLLILMQPNRKLPLSQIDAKGFRANVGIVLANDLGQVFWAKRVGMDAWQFPQGGICPDETVESAMFRELREEVGLMPEHVEILGCTRDWLRYRLPHRFIRRNSRPLCIGQKQIWYLLRLIADDTEVQLDTSNTPEFDHWCWVESGEAVRRVVKFKRQVYQRALDQLAPFMPATEPVQDG